MANEQEADGGEEKPGHLAGAADIDSAIVALERGADKHEVAARLGTTWDRLRKQIGRRRLSLGRTTMLGTGTDACPPDLLEHAGLATRLEKIEGAVAVLRAELATEREAAERSRSELVAGMAALEARPVATPEALRAELARAVAEGREHAVDRAALDASLGAFGEELWRELGAVRELAENAGSAASRRVEQIATALERAHADHLREIERTFLLQLAEADRPEFLRTLARDAKSALAELIEADAPEDAPRDAHARTSVSDDEDRPGDEDDSGGGP